MAEPNSRQIQAPPELVGPDYSVYRYRHDYFKVVRYNSTAPRVGGRVVTTKETRRHDEKLYAALSRARRVCLEVALCNEWKWFCTFTIAKDNFDRKNLDGFYRAFKEWLKYKSMKIGSSLPYLLVPEQHGDGSWHMHGFFTAAIDLLLVSFRSEYDQGMDLPYKLVKHDYYDCPAYRKRFGFCSFGLIRDNIACAFYTTKYITKSLVTSLDRVGLNMYYVSQGLNRSSLIDSVYGRSFELDRLIQHEYAWCGTGYVLVPREVGDDPFLDLIESLQLCSDPVPLSDQVLPSCESELAADEYYQVTMDYLFS